MKFGIDLNQPSTLRGLLTVIASITLGAGVLMGKDISQLVGWFATILGVGGLSGIVIKD